eukprot:6194188-Pleurochrysis_carterae.AAC.11
MQPVNLQPMPWLKHDSRMPSVDIHCIHSRPGTLMYWHLGAYAQVLKCRARDSRLMRSVLLRGLRSFKGRANGSNELWEDLRKVSALSSIAWKTEEEKMNLSQTSSSCSATKETKVRCRGSCRCPLRQTCAWTGDRDTFGDVATARDGTGGGGERARQRDRIGASASSEIAIRAGCRAVSQNNMRYLFRIASHAWLLGSLYGFRSAKAEVPVFHSSLSTLLPTYRVDLCVMWLRSPRRDAIATSAASPRELSPRATADSHPPHALNAEERSAPWALATLYRSSASCLGGLPQVAPDGRPAQIA